MMMSSTTAGHITGAYRRLPGLVVPRRLVGFMLGRMGRRKVVKLALLLGCMGAISVMLSRRNNRVNPDRADDTLMRLHVPSVDKAHIDSYKFLEKPSSLHQRDSVTAHKFNDDVTPAFVWSRDGSPDMKPYEVPPMQAYCNPPFVPMTGSEGLAPEGYTLKLVHVFTRHGDRTSIHRFQGYQPEVFNCNFRKWYNGTNRKFLSFPAAMQNFTGKQHRKSHFLNWALHPNKDVCGDSDLTGIGALHHLNNGQYFHEKYVQQSNLFDTSSLLTSQIHVRSTQVARTYQSAVALLYGFLPVFDTAALTIENSPNFYFCTKKHSLKCVCRFGRTLQDRANRYKSLADLNDTSLLHLRKRFLDLFEIEREHLPWMTALMDAFAAPICHNYSTPCSIRNKNKCVDGSLIAELWNVIAKTEMARLRDPNRNYEKFACVMLQPVLVEIAQRIKDVIEGRQTHKFVLYSGHDITISPLLVVLGLFDGVWPPYASRIVIELFECDASVCSGPRYYLRFLYNGVDRTDHVIFCKGRTDSGLCNVRLFFDYVYKTMLRQFGYTSVGDACLRSDAT